MKPVLKKVTCSTPSKRVHNMKKGLLFLLILVAAASVAAKKNLPIEKESPPSETEIVCFAAMEKWVCAPASDQQQAKDKAMRLIDEKMQQDAVVIQTIPTENQWQAVVVDESATSESPAEISVTLAEPQIEVNSASATVQDNPVITRSEQVEPTADQPVAEVALGSQKQSAHFSDWQANHSQQWTLQAVGTTNLPNLAGYINQNALDSENMAVATTEVKGAPWHIVLVGVFADREQALAYKMEAQSQGASWANQAWPRPIAGIVTID